MGVEVIESARAGQFPSVKDNLRRQMNNAVFGAEPAVTERSQLTGATIETGDARASSDDAPHRQAEDIPMPETCQGLGQKGCESFDGTATVLC